MALPAQRKQPVPPAQVKCVNGKISILVPCYNEEAVLPILFARLKAAAPSWAADY